MKGNIKNHYYKVMTNSALGTKQFSCYFPGISIQMKNGKYLFETIFKTKKDFGNPEKERLQEPLKRKTAGIPQTMRKYY